MGIATSPEALAERLGQRLKQARLNANLTQTEIAEHAGLSRKVVMNAEKGKGQLLSFIAIMMALNLEQHLDNFLPPQDISPLQLAKLKGKQRQRASSQQHTQSESQLGAQSEDALEW